MLKRIIQSFIVVSFILLFTSSSFSVEDIPVYVNDSKVEFDISPAIIDDHMLVPLRKICDAMDVEVKWNSKTKSIFISNNNKEIKLEVSSPIATIDNQVINLDISPRIIDGKTLVPLRFIAEGLDAIVKWDSVAREVRIISTELSDKEKEVLTSFEVFENDIEGIISNFPSYIVHDEWNDDYFLTSDGDYREYQDKISSKEILSKYFSVHLDVENSSNIYWISVYFSENSNLNDYFYMDITPALKDGENQLILHKSEFSVGNGTPEWEKIKYVRLAFESIKDETASVSQFALASYESKPMCTLWFDDGWKNNYSKAYPIMSSYESPIVGEISIISSLINHPLYLNDEELDILVENGWELSNHSYSHQFLPDLSLDQVNLEVILGSNILRRYNNNSTSHLHFAVPYSAVDEKVLDIIKSKTISSRYVPEKMNKLPFDRYAIGFKEVQNTTDPNTVIEWIEESIENQYWLVLMFHKIDDIADERYTYSTENFKQVAEYLAHNQDRIKTVTTSEVFEYILNSSQDEH